MLILLRQQFIIEQSGLYKLNIAIAHVTQPFAKSKKKQRVSFFIFHPPDIITKQNKRAQHF